MERLEFRGVKPHHLVAEDKKDCGYASVKVQYTCKTVVPKYYP